MELRASEADAGERLDAFLAVPLGSRARAQRLIEAGAVLVDGAAVPKRHRVAAGELVVVDEDADRVPQADASQTPSSRSPTSTSTSWSSISRPASWCTRRAATGTG